VHSYEDKSITMDPASSITALTSKGMVETSGKCIFYQVRVRCPDFVRMLFFKVAGILYNTIRIL
jgi:hypothetical protein